MPTPKSSAGRLEEFQPAMFETPELDEFGGYTGKQFDATGYFRLERDDRWWFVTPEGNAFLSFGLNHVRPGRLMADNMVDFWRERFDAEGASIEALLPGFREKVREDVAALGVNTLGCHSPSEFYEDQPVPYVQQLRFVDLCHYMTPEEEHFPDVFADEFVEYCDRIAEELVPPVAEDPYLIGYSFTDCPIFTNLDAAPRISNVYGKPRGGLPTWPNVLRNRDEDAPGKRVYVDTMRERYNGNVQAFNDAYHTEFGSFSDLRNAENWRTGIDQTNDRETEDSLAFLYEIVDRCYEVEADAIRKYDENHLILGDKLNGNTDTPLEIVELADEHMDLVFYQYYAFLNDQRRLLEEWAEVTDKPFLLGDASFSVPNRHMHYLYGPHCPTHEARANRFLEAAEELFGREDFVGWHWCGWIDSYFADTVTHSGIRNPFGEFHEPVREAMSSFSRELYNVGQGEVPEVYL